MNVFRDEMFSTVSAHGRSRNNLLDVLRLADTGLLVDLPGLRPHQRVAVVTDLGILLHLLRRHVTELTIPALEAAIGADTVSRLGRLYAEVDEPAFMQAAQAGTGQAQRLHLENIDVAPVKLAHESRVNEHGKPDHEHAVYALLSGQDAPYVASYREGARWGLMVAIPCDGLTIGSEIKSVADAYDAMSPQIEMVSGHKWLPATGLMDHLPWATSIYDVARGTPLVQRDMAWPPLDTFRPARLNLPESGVPDCLLFSGAVQRVAKNTELFDPHVARDSEGGTVRLMKRVFDYKIVHAVTFGRAKKGVSKGISAAATMDPASNPTRLGYVRFSGMTYETGKTLGFHEMVCRVPKPVARTGFGRAATSDRVGILSSRVTEASSKLTGSLAYSIRDMNRDPEPALARFKSAVGEKTVGWVFERLDVDDTADDGKALADVMSTLALGIFAAEADAALAVGTSALAVARARINFEGGLYANLSKDGINTMDADEIRKNKEWPTAATVRQAIAAMSHEIAAPNGEMAKRLRTMHADAPGMTLWRVLANPAVPNAWAHLKLWTVLLPAMARLPHRYGDKVAGSGRSMFAGGVSEDRMDRLLLARGETLIQEIVQSSAIMAGRGSASLNWNDLAILLIADALGDEEELLAARRRVAMDYARASRPQRAA